MKKHFVLRLLYRYFQHTSNRQSRVVDVLYSDHNSDMAPISPNNIVPSISAKNTCPPVKTSSSQELDPKARAVTTGYSIAMARLN